MKTRSGCIRVALALAGLLTVPGTNAWAGRGGGHGGRGHGARAPRVSTPRGGGFKAPRMPHVKTPARASTGRVQGHATHARSTTNQVTPHANHTPNHSTTAGKLAPNSTVPTRRAASATVSPATSSSAVKPGGLSGTGTIVPGRINPLTPAVAGATLTNPSGVYGNHYTYGYGQGARAYRAYGYGSGYRNRYYGRRYGYGRSQRSNRAILARLRSVEMQLARIDQDYQGHRVRAMRSVSMAIRQLSHRSMIYSGVGFAPGMNNGRRIGMGMGMGMGRGGLGGNGAGRMPQAQSDARMSHALRTLQGVNMQLGSQGSYTMGHARARGHVMQAIRELSTALSIR